MQRACLAEAVSEAWSIHKQDTNITKIAEILFKKDGQVNHDLGQMLYPFTKNGPYGKYFEGKANVTFQKQLSVIEMEELKNRKDLQTVVLKIMMIQISNQMLGDQRQLFQIVMDECWDLLRGKQTAPFMEALARKIRKYGGGLLCGTQNLSDYFDVNGDKAGAQAVYDNSEFAYILKQKPETIRNLKNSGRITEEEANFYSSIQSVKGVYSEVCIKDSNGMSVGRYRTDNFTRLLFSTDATDTADINKKISEGMETLQAVEAVLHDRGQGV